MTDQEAARAVAIKKTADNLFALAATADENNNTKLYVCEWADTAYYAVYEAVSLEDALDVMSMYEPVQMELPLAM